MPGVSEAGARFVSLPRREARRLLSHEQVAAFHARGFVTLERITSAAEVALLRPVFERLFAQRAGRREGAQYDLVSHDDDAGESKLPTIINPLNYAPELRRLQFRRNALAIAKQLLGPEVTPAFEHAIMKPPLQGAATPWHQDEAYRVDPGFAYRQVSFWMPLQEATLENGCMHYLPGTNQGEVLRHRSFNNDPKNYALEYDGRVDRSAAVACPLAAGGVAIHHGRTIHYAGPNRTAAPRYAYILAFELPPKLSRESRAFAWNDSRTAANLLRRRAWRRRGGIIVEAVRKIRLGVLSSPARIAFEFRRGLRAVLRWRWRR